MASIPPIQRSYHGVLCQTIASDVSRQPTAQPQRHVAWNAPLLSPTWPHMTLLQALLERARINIRHLHHHFLDDIYYQPRRGAGLGE